jgi:hypothetical protein
MGCKPTARGRKINVKPFPAKQVLSQMAKAFPTGKKGKI